MELKKIFKNCKPLFFHDSNLILGKRDSVFLLMSDDSLKLLFKLPNVWMHRLLDRFNLYFRARRGGVYSGTCYGEFYFLCHNRRLYSYHFPTSTLVLDKTLERGRGPLQFSTIENITGFESGIYYGEYFENPEMEEVHIFKRSPEGGWNRIYSFKKGTINHIHSLIPDPDAECVWILTGDFGEAAGVWRASDNFNTVEAVVGGEQRYRSCVAFPVGGGLLYATDSQFETNSVRLLRKVDGCWSTEKLIDINGPVIYGCELRDHYVFSCSSEPGEELTNTLSNLLDRQPGPGIRKNESQVISCRKDNFMFSLVKSAEKDRYPFRLFQFGSIMFAYGVSRDNTLYAYHVATKENDLCMERIECH